MVESHVKFWDRDSDGIISPLDVYKGFKELGFNLIISIASMFMYVRIPSQRGRKLTEAPRITESAEDSPTSLRRARRVIGWLIRS